jgi:DTW domain-containing protein YfiP
VAALPARERHEALLRQQKRDLESRDRCASCFFVPARCICSQIRTAPPWRHKVVVLMHLKELYTASNTGKLARLCLPGAECLCRGLQEDELRLETLLGEYEGRTVVLFPSQAAVPAEQHPLHEGPARLIVVLDGTWRQAKRLQRGVPLSVPRIKVLPEIASTFQCRKYALANDESNEQRVCTIEALALLLRPHFAGAATALLDSFAVLMQSYQLQHGQLGSQPHGLSKVEATGELDMANHKRQQLDSALVATTGQDEKSLHALTEARGPV